MNRRDFLFCSSTAAAAAMFTPRVLAQTPWKAYPFSLGIASGEPGEDSVVLWTRLAPDFHDPRGGMPDQFVAVHWEVADDENMRNIVKQGTAYAGPNFAHSVHVEVAGLRPGRWYWYRFHSGDATSPVGRTRTAPALDAMQEEIRFAFVSCQKYEDGYYTAFERLAEEAPDVILHLGDYIYEHGVVHPKKRDVLSRLPPEQTCITLDQYRFRYSLYKSDPQLQKAHQVAPWVVTPDDHEVSNDYAGDMDDHAGRIDPRGEFLLRRAAAYQAYYEHMPLRRFSRPNGPSIQLYRAISYGRLATFYVLDTRQYRSPQPCGDRAKPVCEGALAATQTLMGAKQEKWLYQLFSKSQARWNVIAQQVLMSQVNWNPAGHPILESMDKWDGYHAARQRLYRNIVDRKLRNPVVLSGDIHLNFANDLKTGRPEDKTPVIATEFVGTSVTSDGDGCDISEEAKKWLRFNPQVRFFNEQRGYVTCKVTPEMWTSDYRVLDYVSRPGGSVSTRASMIVENGKPGTRKS